MNSSKRKSHFLQTSLHESIYVESNFFSISSPKCQLVAVHGMGTYAGWFNDLNLVLSENKIASTALDLPGFGRSGTRGEIKSYNSWVEALKETWKEATLQSENEKTFLIGHSLGAIICLAALPSLKPKPQGLIITSPGFMANLQSWSLFDFMVPTLLKALINHPEKIAPPFPPEVFEALQKGQHKIDFLTAEVKPKLLLEMLKASQKAFWSFKNLKEMPLLMVLAGADKFCSNSASEIFFNLSNSSKKTLKTYAGLPHDLFVVPEAEEINHFILEWIKQNNF